MGKALTAYDRWIPVVVVKRWENWFTPFLRGSKLAVPEGPRGMQNFTVAGAEGQSLRMNQKSQQYTMSQMRQNPQKEVLTFKLKIIGFIMEKESCRSQENNWGRYKKEIPWGEIKILQASMLLHSQWDHLCIFLHRSYMIPSCFPWILYVAI